MIYQGSRYEGQPLFRALDANGERRPAVLPFRDLDVPVTVRRHLVVQGDRLDLLAYDEYGDPTEWWRIADANRELGVVDPLVPGTILLIPVL